MTSFPFDWQIFPSSDFNSMELAVTQDTGLGARPYLLLNPDGSAAGNFRIAFSGTTLFGKVTPITQLIPEIPENLSTLHISYFSRGAGAEPPVNALSTPWTDLEDLLRQNLATTTDGAGNTVPDMELLAFLACQPADKTGLGASFRWAIGVGQDKLLRLEMQALPARARYLSKCSLKSDDAVATYIGEIPILCEYFDSAGHAGPVPHFFADDPAAMLPTLARDQVPVYNAVRALNIKFMHHELLNPEDALNYIRGRHRQARAVSAYLHPGPPTAGPPGPPTAGPSTKRQRLDNASSVVETGTVFSVNVFVLFFFLLSFPPFLPSALSLSS
jgi:hypothetical protein